MSDGLEKVAEFLGKAIEELDAITIRKPAVLECRWVMRAYNGGLFISESYFTGAEEAPWKGHFVQPIEDTMRPIKDNNCFKTEAVRKHEDSMRLSSKC
jgi:hypothetical protein